MHPACTAPPLLSVISGKCVQNCACSCHLCKACDVQLLNLLACCFCMLLDEALLNLPSALTYVLVPTPLSFASDLVDTRFFVFRNGHLRRLEAVFQFVHIAALYHSDVMLLEIFADIFGW
jgi:hypothetical protein